ncbi:LMF2 factor, partial [Polypterus senegalus]
MLKYMGKPLLEQLWDSPTFLWLGPKLGLDTQQGMELICLLGIILSFGAMVFETLRDSLVFFFLWTLYLSVYQCIPTPVAWFAHQLPDWFQKLSVVGTYIIEIAVPFLFFIPLRRLQLFSFYLQVPFTYIEYDANSRLWPAVRKMYEAVDRYQLVNSYGLFRSMTGIGGRPEVVLEGSYDKETWTEIDFMYKPGNVSITTPIVIPHQPRLDWQMWFAALGPHTRSPWFSSLVQRLLQGKKDVIELIQADGFKYPFSKSPPTFIRAKLYKYWYTLVNKDGSLPQNWWRRQYVEEFFPTVFLGDPNLESMLSHYGLKDRVSTKRISDAFLPTILRTLRENVQTLTGPQFVWSLFCSGAAICLLKGFFSSTRSNKHKPVFETKKSKGKDTGSGMAKNEQVKKKADRSQESLEAKQPESSEGGFADSDKSTKKRK